MQQNLPPVWSKIAKHDLLPETTHDERARFNFLANLNKHLSAVISPGNKPAYEKRVKPNFQAENGRDFASRDEVREAMKKDPHYQAWSALRRATMEMRQQAGRSTVLRQAQSLAEKAEQLNRDSDQLRLDPDLPIPPYMRIMDNHLMPGSYHTEQFKGDVSNAANYDLGLFITTAGMLGKLNDGGGKAIAKWLLETHPEFQPKRILDIGCGLGHNVVPIALAYPDAEIVAIDTGAPMLNYGHARAKALGVKNIQFVQMNAEVLDFPDQHFDWVQTTMFLHETAGKAIFRIMAEIYRVLTPGGITLHIEQPQYTPDMDLYEQFIRDWDAYYNNEPFWSKMHDIDPVGLMGKVGFKAADFMQIGVKAVNDLDDGKAKKDEPEDHGRSPKWNVFGAWKR
jgi:ubiquinone/menaquinone biosynthesis C-methylase UbiE